MKYYVTGKAWNFTYQNLLIYKYYVDHLYHMFYCIIIMILLLVTYSVDGHKKPEVLNQKKNSC